MNDDDIEQLKEMASRLPIFKQFWREHHPGDILQLVEEHLRYIPGESHLSILEEHLSFAKALSALFLSLDKGEDDSDFISKFFQNFNPHRHQLSEIEWLVLLKQYLMGNHNVFDHIPSIMEPYNRWKSAQAALKA